MAEIDRTCRSYGEIERKRVKPLVRRLCLLALFAGIAYNQQGAKEAVKGFYHGMTDALGKIGIGSSYQSVPAALLVLAISAAAFAAAVKIMDKLVRGTDKEAQEAVQEMAESEPLTFKPN